METISIVEVKEDQLIKVAAFICIIVKRDFNG